jgi:hypothetical protein
MPPSLIGFLLKNIGEDLSTVKAPTSLPLFSSAIAEKLEYATALEIAASQKVPKPRQKFWGQAQNSSQMDASVVLCRPDGSA